MSAVITGGASGLGAATARVLNEAGVKIAIFDLDETGGKKVASDLGGVFCNCDVTHQDNIAQALESARAANGQERILVNCAGVAMGGRTARRNKKTGDIEPHDLKSFAKVININLLGTFNMMALSAAGMMTLDPVTPDGGRGVMVNTASVAAQDGQIGQAAYAASKGALNTLTLGLARALAPEIRVNAVCPGYVDTPWHSGKVEDADELETYKQRFADIAPLKRLTTADDVADAVNFFALGAKAITGAVLVVDGGTHLTVGSPQNT